MKLNNIVNKNKQIFYHRNKINLILANIIKETIIEGNSKLKEPLQKGDLSIITIFDAIKSQRCIRIFNYKPDEHNKHLSHVSLGPSYLEQQVNSAINKATEDNKLSQSYATYLRAEIGLNTPTPKQLKEEKLKDLDDAKIMIDIPSSRQSQKTSCGATVVQMINAYYGCNIKEYDLIKELETDKNSGARLSDIKKVLKEFGLKPRIKYLDYDKIISTIKHKIPLILTVDIDDGGKKAHHFVIAVGFYNNGIICRDPSKFVYGYLSIDELKDRCLQKDDKYVTLVVKSKDKPKYSKDKIEKI